MTFERINIDNNVRPVGHSCILVYGYDEETFELINHYSIKTYTVKAKAIEEDMIHLTLEQMILKANSYDKNRPQDQKVKIILFNALSDSEIHQFVEYIKASKIKNPIFAAVTEHSKKWKFNELINELIEENNAIADMMKRKKVSVK